MSRVPRRRSPLRGSVDPGDYVGIVGESFLAHERRPLLSIGTRTWSRWSLGNLGCPHPMAATALNRVVQELGITSMAGLAARATDIGKYKGLGVTAYWVVLAILREAGFDVEAVHGQDVTYQTMKQRARAVEEAQRKRDAPRHRPRRRRTTEDQDEDRENKAAAAAARSVLKTESNEATV